MVCVGLCGICDGTLKGNNCLQGGSSSHLLFGNINVCLTHNVLCRHTLGQGIISLLIFLFIMVGFSFWKGPKRKERRIDCDRRVEATD